MSIRPSLFWLISAAALSVVVMVACAHMQLMPQLYGAALLFGALMIIAAILTNAPALASERPAVSPADAARETTKLTALVYGWGAVALLAIYLGTPVQWRHGWQYALALALICAGHIEYVRRAKLPMSPIATPFGVRISAWLAALQAGALAVTLVWMVTSGKFETTQGDWAANAVFLAGILAVIGVCVTIVVAHIAMPKRA